MTDQGRFYYAIVDKESARLWGLFLMRIDPANRVIEVGAVTSLALQKTRMATEAQYLLARYVFEI